MTQRMTVDILLQNTPLARLSSANDWSQVLLSYLQIHVLQQSKLMKEQAKIETDKEEPVLT